MKITEAIILAGGLGTRLRETVPDLPKCMAPVNEKPFISYVIDYFLLQGIEHFIFALGYKNEVMTLYINENYPDLSKKYCVEDEPLGTGGAIKLACQQATTRNVLVANGDTLFKIDLNEIAAFHTQTGAHCTVSLKFVENFDRYGVVDINDNCAITSFKEKAFYEQGLINGGVYGLHVEHFLEEELPYKFSFEKDYLEAYYTKRRMFGIEQDGYFIDIGIKEDFERAQEELR